MNLISQASDKPIRQTLRDKLGTIFFIFCIALYIYLANKLRYGPEAGDETEKLVLAMMIQNGGHLYRDVFSHHGPLSFMLAHVYLAITGIKNMGTYRLVPLLTSLGMIAAIFFSPIFKNSSQRKLAASITMLGLAANQAIFGLVEGTYQIYAGHLLVCALALFVLPVLFDCPLKRISAFLGGLAMGLAFFAAYSYVVSCCCFFCICAYKAYCCRREPVNLPLQWGGCALLGALFSAVIVFVWLFCFGDVLGYFVYHFYFNQFIYSHFIHFNPGRIFLLMVPVVNYFYVNSVTTSGATWAPSDSFWIDCTIFFCIFFYSVILWIFKRKDSKTPTWPAFGLLFIGIIYTNMRGCVGYEANTIAIVSLGFMGLATAIILVKEQQIKIFIKRTTKFVTGMVMIIFIAAQFFATSYAYNATPIHYYAHKYELGLSQAPEMQFIRSFVNLDETIEVLPIDLFIYLQAGRLPASGDAYYLPWQGAYFKKPILGYKIDLCHDIEQKRPKAIILMQNMSVWGYDISTYMSCVQDILKKQYVMTKAMKDLWIRADVAAANDNILKTAIVPKDFDDTWLPAASQKRLDALKK